MQENEKEYILKFIDRLNKITQKSNRFMFRREPSIDGTKLLPFLANTIVALPIKPKDNDNGFVSRIGGLPSVPKGFNWPKIKLSKPRNTPDQLGDTPKEMWDRYTASEGSLHFIAQINLEELPECPYREALPPKGQLYFFCDATGNLCFDDPRFFRVIYTEASASDLTPASMPNDMLAPDIDYDYDGFQYEGYPGYGDDEPPLETFKKVSTLEEFTSAFFTSVSLEQTYPFSEDEEKNTAKNTKLSEKLAATSMIDNEMESIDYDPDEIDTDELNELIKETKHVSTYFYRQPVNKMGGECYFIRDIWRNNCVSFFKEHFGDDENNIPENWVHLFQVDTMNEIGDDQSGRKIIWGDCGTLYFAVLKTDLEAKRFDRAVLLMESC